MTSDTYANMLAVLSLVSRIVIILVITSIIDYFFNFTLKTILWCVFAAIIAVGKMHLNGQAAGTKQIIDLLEKMKAQ